MILESNQNPVVTGRPISFAWRASIPVLPTVRASRRLFANDSRKKGSHDLSFDVLVTLSIPSPHESRITCEVDRRSLRERAPINPTKHRNQKLTAPQTVIFFASSAINLRVLSNSLRTTDCLY
jgi:hypothetical protein